MKVYLHVVAFNRGSGELLEGSRLVFDDFEEQVSFWRNASDLLDTLRSKHPGCDARVYGTGQALPLEEAVRRCMESPPVSATPRPAARRDWHRRA